MPGAVCYGSIRKSEPSHDSAIPSIRTAVPQALCDVAVLMLDTGLRLGEVLAARQEQAQSLHVFPGHPNDGKPGSKPYRGTSLNHQHQKVRALLKLPPDFVLHSFRHTMLTRLGEAGVDAFTIMRIPGHSSVTVSQRYVHPTPEALERAFERTWARSSTGRATDS